MKCALLKIIVHSEVLERAKRFEADNLERVQPSSSKDGQALRKLLEFVATFIQLRISKANWREMACSALHYPLPFLLLLCGLFLV